VIGERDPRKRFTDRASFYEASRPAYPAAILPILRSRLGLAEGWLVADVGCGTGLLAQRLLDADCRVIGVEPNAAMRAVAERRLGGRPGFSLMEGAAEETGLAAGSVDLVVAGQAFHWFDAAAARREFARILKPPGRVALLWNDRRSEASGFMEGYEALLLRHGRDYREVHHRNVGPDVFDAFFGPVAWRRDVVDNAQSLDWEGLAARLLSSSYLPGPLDPGSDAMLEEARGLFARFEREGAVELVYGCTLVTGSFSPPASPSSM
jgi:SAM-dependent methyltransferase